MIMNPYVVIVIYRRKSCRLFGFQ